MGTVPGERVTLFIPDQVCKRSDVNFGLLFGHHQKHESITYVCVTSFLPVSKEDVLKRPTIKKKFQLIGKNPGNQMIGFISSSGKVLSEKVFDCLSRNKPVFTHILKQENGLISVLGSKIGKTASQSTKIIYFNPEDIMASNVIKTKYGQEVELNRSSFCFPNFLIQSFKESIIVTSTFKYCKLFCKKSLVANINLNGHETNEVIYGNRLGEIICMTTTGSQLLFKLRQFRHVISHVHRTRNRDTGKVSWKMSNPLSVGNIVSSLIIDVLLGFLVTLVLVQSFNRSKVLEFCEQSANQVVGQLKQLLYHLISMPAGLKLNRPLNESLGQFFLYHIYLWSTYMSLVKPIYDQISKVIIYFGLFGLTFTLSIVTDLFSLATIHIYCFYGYAAKLFSFQVNGLISLWRLFRGKKWNELKQRVDSYHYTNDQLFIGSIFFTVLLFLLPTVLLYYSVFLVLRLLTLMIQFTLRTLILRLSTLPGFALLHWIISSSKISSDVYIEAVKVEVNDDDDKGLITVLHVRTTKLSIIDLFETNPEKIKSPLMSESKLTLGVLLKYIVTGKIIYPL